MPVDDYLKRSAARLLREDWKNPESLARELYAIFADRPVEGAPTSSVARERENNAVRSLALDDSGLRSDVAVRVPLVGRQQDGQLEGEGTEASARLARNISRLQASLLPQAGSREAPEGVPGFGLGLGPSSDWPVDQLAPRPEWEGPTFSRSDQSGELPNFAFSESDTFDFNAAPRPVQEDVSFAAREAGTPFAGVAAKQSDVDAASRPKANLFSPPTIKVEPANPPFPKMEVPGAASYGWPAVSDSGGGNCFVGVTQGGSSVMLYSDETPVDVDFPGVNSDETIPSGVVVTVMQTGDGNYVGAIPTWM